MMRRVERVGCALIWCALTVWLVALAWSVVAYEV